MSSKDVAYRVLYNIRGNNFFVHFRPIFTIICSFCPKKNKVPLAKNSISHWVGEIYCFASCIHFIVVLVINFGV